MKTLFRRRRRKNNCFFAPRYLAQPLSPLAAWGCSSRGSHGGGARVKSSLTFLTPRIKGNEEGRGEGRQILPKATDEAREHGRRWRNSQENEGSE